MKSRGAGRVGGTGGGAGSGVWAAAAAVLLGIAASSAATDPPPPAELTPVEQAIVGQSLADAAGELEAAIAARGDDNQAIFALGVVQFLQSGEHLAQAAHRYGASAEQNPLLMFAQLPTAPVPGAVQPEELSYEALREIVTVWRSEVARAEATLARVGEGDVKLRIPIGLIRMDYNGDGAADPNEALWLLFNRAQRRFDADESGAGEFIIAFDRGDVEWLRGYCHICLAAAEVILAHDWRALFENCAHLAFAKPVTPHKFLLSRIPDEHEPWLDLIAMVHLINFEVTDPAGLERARHHLISAIGRSRAMWRHFDAETDDDREWIPNPRQTAAIPGARVDDEMREMWLLFLDEAEEVLEGNRLVRFWRPTDTRGINLKRVFTEPRRFDLVLWVQGTAAAPYLEDGQTTSPRLWDRMERAFGHQVFRHSFWFN